MLPESLEESLVWIFFGLLSAVGFHAMRDQKTKEEAKREPTAIPIEETTEEIMEAHPEREGKIFDEYTGQWLSPEELKSGSDAMAEFINEENPWLIKTPESILKYNPRPALRDFELLKSACVDQGFVVSRRTISDSRRMMSGFYILGPERDWDIHNLLQKNGISLIFGELLIPDSLDYNVVLHREIPFDAGNALIVEESLETRMSEYLEPRETKMDHVPDFCRKFHVLASNETALKANLGLDFLQELEKSRKLEIEFRGNEVLMISTRRPDPFDLQQQIEIMQLI